MGYAENATGVTWDRPRMREFERGKWSVREILKHLIKTLAHIVLLWTSFFLPDIDDNNRDEQHEEEVGHVHKTPESPRHQILSVIKS